MMDDATKRRLKELAQQKKIETFKADIGFGRDTKTFSCVTCNVGIRTPRILLLDGKRRPSVIWCSQECVDAYLGRFRYLRGLRYEWKDAAGILLGYYLPKRGFVTLEEIYAAKEAATPEVSSA